MRISANIDINEPSEDEYRLFAANSMTNVFASFRPPYLCLSDRYKHGVSIHTLITLSKTFLRTSPARNLAKTWIFARLFEYSYSFASLFLTLFVEWFWWWCVSENRFILIFDKLKTGQCFAKYLYSAAQARGIPQLAIHSWLTVKGYRSLKEWRFTDLRLSIYCLHNNLQNYPEKFKRIAELSAVLDFCAQKLFT